MNSIKNNYAFVLKSINNNDNLNIMETKGRVIYICVGIDRGIKTWYITNGYKHRNKYLSRDNVHTLNNNEIKKVFS